MADIEGGLFILNDLCVRVCVCVCWSLLALEILFVLSSLPTLSDSCVCVGRGMVLRPRNSHKPLWHYGKKGGLLE